MKVVKRSGRHEDVKFDQITDRLNTLSPDLSIDPIKIARSVCAQIKEFITTRELDELSATICASLSIQEPEYDILGTRILMSSHNKDTSEDFVDVVRSLQGNKDILDKMSPILDDTFATYVLDNADVVSAHFRKCGEAYPLYQMSMFGWKTLYRSYLLQSNRHVVERPEHLFYRVALSLHFPNLERTEESYRHLASGHFIHATPTLFHAGTVRQQLSSCFLTTSTDDVDGIYKNISNVAKISKWAGGIGVHISHIRSKNSYIRGTNGFSNGIMPMLRVYNDTSRYIDQCVDAYTPVFTLDGPKPICRVEPWKDSILQRNGTYEVLLKKLEHSYKGDVLEFTMSDGTSLTITPEHPMYGRHVVQEKGVPDRMNGKVPYWIDAEDVRCGDEIAFPIPSSVYENHDDISNESLFCWGLLLGWGQMTFEDGTVDISFPIQTPRKVLDTFQYFLSTRMIYFHTHLSAESIHLRFVRTNLFPIKYHHLYDMGNETRRMHIHSSLLHVALDKLSCFLHGFLLSHASYETPETIVVFDIFDTHERYAGHVVESLLYLFARIGLVLQRVKDTGADKLVVSVDGLASCGLSVYTWLDHVENGQAMDVIGGRTFLQQSLMKHQGEESETDQAMSSDISFPLQCATREAYLYKQVSTVRRSQYEGLLYDLEFEKEHSYAVPTGILHNGGGKRKGSFAMYLEPWHADIFEFVFAKRNVGNEDERARDLFYGLWIPDLFMKRVEKNEVWSLMCPNVCKGLVENYGETFDTLYTKYESEGKFVRQVPARELWKEILHSQIETGLPYMLYKDSCNSKSNQKNLGTIRSSNLCCEIIEYSDSNEYSVCNLASINLSNCIKDRNVSETLQSVTIYTKSSCGYCALLKKRLERRGIDFIELDVSQHSEAFEALTDRHRLEKTVPKIVVNEDESRVYGFTDFWKEHLQPVVDYEELAKRVSVLVVNMNAIIDKNFYPTEETEVSNRRHRPIGIGVQGLADLFCKLYIPFDSEQARDINKKIFETMYFAALKKSNEYAVENGLVYSTFQGSPLSQGILHFDMCPTFDKDSLTRSPCYDWESLRKTIVETGVSNSLFIAPMPTASTSQILYQNECFEPFTSNLYVRRTLAGEYTIFNKYLVQDLRDIGLWNQETIDHLIVHKGSIQNFVKLPAMIRSIYRTAWEIPQKSLIDMAAERQWFIDQSQSFNLFVADPSPEKLTKIHFYGWKRGLKTGSYYIRTKPQHFSQNFTIDPTKEDEISCTTCSA